MTESFAFYDLAQSMVAGDRRYATVVLAFEECCIWAYRDGVYGLDCIGARKTCRPGTLPTFYICTDIQTTRIVTCPAQACTHIRQ